MTRGEIVHGEPAVIGSQGHAVWHAGMSAEQYKLQSMGQTS